MKHVLITLGLVALLCTSTSVFASPFPLTGLATRCDMNGNPVSPEETFDFGTGEQWGTVWYCNPLPSISYQFWSMASGVAYLIDPATGQNKWMFEWEDPPGRWRVYKLLNLTDEEGNPYTVWNPEGTLGWFF